MEIDWACQQTLAELFYCLDERRYESLTALFEVDGEWLRQGKELKGRTEIMAALNARSATYVIRHVLSNFLVTSRDDEQLDCVGYLTPFAHDSGSIAEKPVTLHSPLAIFVSRATFRRVDGAVSLKRLELWPEFVFQQAG